jgi:riboflavin kinase/FMN adenylyltransferase
MKLIRHLNQINSKLDETVLTIGNFDGVHIAHQNIINKTINLAKNQGLKSAILTFEPHPIAFLNSHNPQFKNNFRIINLAQKLNILLSFPLDYIIILPFNYLLSNINADDFIQKILIDKINAKSLVVGYDFTFGKNREGNFKTLENYNFDLHEINPIKFIDNNQHEITISSSQCRNYLKNGDIINLNKILGYNYSIQGDVISGEKLATKLGFPTANIKYNPHFIAPKFGVYASKISFKNSKNPFKNISYNSITNFGIKPTFSKDSLPIFESHIFNFNENIYGKNIKIEFLDFIRDEKKFSSVEELKNQIRMDINNFNHK